ncbi:cyclin- protein [Cymbomonas tetramitiformis]|uniref:Cyclin- protein n=1 Tax=Cymbomonas tetramitiformis TaxID=36881 RepID=A0AAE0F5J8_9CHLO|nr:cyclin- protein [Cymbomonas tetramitiformis]
MSMKEFVSDGRIPGYQGYIPSMNNHVIGKRYTDATNVADDCSGVLATGANPSSMESLVDNRPQGRHFLYAQVADHGPQEDPRLAPPHVGKRIPLKNEALGYKDFRLMQTKIGGLGDHNLPTVKSASLPSLPYNNKAFQTKKVYMETLPPEAQDPSGNLPGYTGHQHADQHIFAKSYGSTSRHLGGGSKMMTSRSHEMIRYEEGRPVGNTLNGKHRIPGYQGYIPSKDNHIYGKTYGKCTELAPDAESTMRGGANGGETLRVSSMDQLVDSRPQGRIELYAEATDINPQEPPKKLLVHKGKGMVDIKYTEMGKDYKVREMVSPDVQTVKTGKHRIVGYTGHVHGGQHVYATSYGQMTRKLHGGEQMSDPNTSDKLLYWADDRPHQQ